MALTKLCIHIQKEPDFKNIKKWAPFVYIYKRANKILNYGKVDCLREKRMVLLNCPKLSAPGNAPPGNCFNSVLCFTSIYEEVCAGVDNQSVDLYLGIPVWKPKEKDQNQNTR